MVGVDRRQFSSVGRKDLFWAQNQKCFYCGNHMKPNDVTRDHLYPKCQGRELVLNCVICCKKCNHAKADRMPTYAELTRARRLYVSLGCPAFCI